MQDVKKWMGKITIVRTLCNFMLANSNELVVTVLNYFFINYLLEIKAEYGKVVYRS